ncbi:hypothetical protein [Pseudomonas sp. 5P_5.1_Bac1]|uniref:hypothetical protein n=1 Tax=Pseudomonas sp. 5P_5.1_Bac1 TaxID=2971616 RepID=UPI0021C626F5|nr:hypothetical protein [Pseudomonas sp. 5P_5.1_Bac1]MCU1723800.1 hypothetical protein [Pseudomonas sp. 5P_5.1_Bac1]
MLHPPRLARLLCVLSLAIALPSTAAASESSDALALLSWPSHVGKIDNPPTAILLPEAVYRQIREMTAQTQSDGRERGSCLFKSGNEVSLSQIFKGQQFSIDMGEYLSSCPQSSLSGIIHTHPEIDRNATDIGYRAAPSLDDFVNFGFSRFPASIIAHKDYVCAMFKSPQKKDFALTKAIYDQYSPQLVKSFVLNMLAEDAPAPGQSTVANLRAVGAAMGMWNQLFYCGRNGGSLTRILPRDTSTSMNRLVLATQGLVLAEYLSGNYPYSKPTFLFAPNDQAELARYLNRAIGQKTGTDFSRLDARQTFEKVLELHWVDSYAISATASSFSVPSRKDDGLAYTFSCTPALCTLVTNRSFYAFDAKRDHTVAAYVPNDNGYDSVINLSADERVRFLAVYSNKSSMKYLEHKRDRDDWVPVAGSGLWRFEGGQVEGDIKDGRINGPVIVHLDDGRVFKGTVGRNFDLTFGEQIR